MNIGEHPSNVPHIPWDDQKDSKWAEFLTEEFNNNDGIDADVYIDEDDTVEIIRVAYGKGLDPEVLLASRKSRLVQLANRLRNEKPRKLKVVVVDDEEAFLNLVTVTLEKTGRYESLGVSDSSHAMEEIDKFAPDIAILDIGMPGVNGIEIADRIRANSRWFDLPIIMFSAFVGDIGRKGVAAHRMLYLAKTVSLSHLLHCVDEHLSSSLPADRYYRV